MEARAAIINEYVFLNADTGVYLYHEDTNLLSTEYREIIECIQAVGDTQANTYSYRDERMKRHWGWCFFAIFYC